MTTGAGDAYIASSGSYLFSSSNYLWRNDVPLSAYALAIGITGLCVSLVIIKGLVIICDLHYPITPSDNAKGTCDTAACLGRGAITGHQ
jgi:hypothetical protein